MTAWIALFIIVLIPTILLIWAILIFNRLIRGKNLVAEGWSGIDTQLKRRANLIPNLVTTVKGYAGYEGETLKRVTELRARSLAADTVGEQGRVEGDLSAALGRLIAVAEDYPDLKANENFLDLQEALAEVEDQIQLARRYYNGTVRDLNILIESFPSNLVAGSFNFPKAEFFELTDPADAAVPEVTFG
jgi:LemA protein